MAWYENLVALQLQRLEVFSDGCGAQFWCVDKLAAQCSFSFDCLWDKFAPGHGKGLVDAEGGLAKNACKRAQAYEGGARIGSAQAMAEYLHSTHTQVAASVSMGRSSSMSGAPLQQRTVHYVPQEGSSSANAPEFQVDPVQRGEKQVFSPIPRLRQYSSSFTRGTNSNGGDVKLIAYVSKESCPCNECRVGNFANCSNAHHKSVGWETHQLVTRQEQQEMRHVHRSATEDCAANSCASDGEDSEELAQYCEVAEDVENQLQMLLSLLNIQLGMVCAVRPDAGYEGQQVLPGEFWLFKCLTQPEQVQPSESYTDDYGVYFGPSAWLVKGHWLEQTDEDDLEYRVVYSKAAAVEVQSFYVGGTNVQLLGQAANMSQSQSVEGVVRSSLRLANKVQVANQSGGGLLTLPVLEAERLSRASLHG